MKDSSKYYFDDFTENNYKRLLLLAKEKYTFVEYGDYKNLGKNILWRHDIDFSVHRAYKLALIEKSVGIKSTYFIYPHSFFYNIFEHEIFEILKNIISLGNNIGLHFDASFYGKIEDQNPDYRPFIKYEKNILEKLFNQKLIAISFHTPEYCIGPLFSKTKINGMINCYSKYIMNNYGYCSDSDGYWRFRRLEDVLIEAKDNKLQVLTHPELWTPTPMSPRNRISRCIVGRSIKQQKEYDSLLKRYGRAIIK